MRDKQSWQFERYYPISELNYKHLKNAKICSVYGDNIFPVFREFHAFSIESLKIISNFGPLQRMSRMTKHVSKARIKVDPGDRITPPGKIACKPELTLTRLLG